MRKSLLLSLLLSTLGVSAQTGPTMGWSSWNTYGVNINEEANDNGTA